MHSIILNQDNVKLPLWHCVCEEMINKQLNSSTAGSAVSPALVVVLYDF